MKSQKRITEEQRRHRFAEIVSKTFEIEELLYADFTHANISQANDIFQRIDKLKEDIEELKVS